MTTRPSIADSAIKGVGSQRQETRLLRETETIKTPDMVDKQTKDQLNEEDSDPEITWITMANIATTANSKDIDSKNAGKGSKRTNHAGMPKDD